MSQITATSTQPSDNGSGNDQRAVVPTQQAETPQRHVVVDRVPTLDTAKFEHLQRIATMMACSTLVPEHLRKGEKNEAIANCFLVANQAVLWGMDPFAVAQCTSVISGKLCYEGKLVAAVLATKIGVRLRYEWTGERGTVQRGIVVSGVMDGETLQTEGTVAEWKTTRTGSPWIVPQYDKMLAYRGAREWARLHAPEVMLGVYVPDEMENDRRPPMRDITPAMVDPNALRDPDIDLTDDAIEEDRTFVNGDVIAAQATDTPVEAAHATQ